MGTLIVGEVTGRARPPGTVGDLGDDAAPEPEPAPSREARPATVASRLAGWARGRRWKWPVVVFAGYLGLSVLVWAHVWFGGHPASTAACGCGDPAQAVWSLRWVPFALGHGLDPFFSGYLFAPDGVNLLDNTSALLPALVLAPVTAVAGPVFSLNVLLTLAPAINACCAYAAVRRFTGRRSPAFAGGLLYGFAPFVLDSTFLGHLQFAVLAVPPLLLIVLYETVVRQAWSERRSALSLAALVVAQFFIGTEVLALTVLVTVLGLAVLAGLAPHRVREAAAHAARPLLVGSGIAAVLLAWPVWFAVAGPRHFIGVQHPGVEYAGVSFRSIIDPGALATTPSPFGSFVGYGGAQGPSSLYLGVVLATVLVVGSVALWRLTVVRWCVAMTVLTGLLAGGVTFGTDFLAPQSPFAPWRYVSHLPLLAEATPSHMAAVTMLFVAVLFGVVLDRLAGWAVRWVGARPGPAETSTTAAAALAEGNGRARPDRPAGWGWVAPVVVAVVGAVSLVPVAGALGLPAAVQPVTTPPGLDRVLATTPTGSDLLTYPFTSAFDGSPLVWQAQSGFSFRVVGGFGFAPGPAGAKLSATDLSTAYGVLANLNQGPVGTLMVGQLALARADVVRGGVTEALVVPVGPVDRWEYALAFFTALLGRAPVRDPGGVWVWRGPADRSPVLAATNADLTYCTAVGEATGPAAVPGCVLRVAPPAG